MNGPRPVRAIRRKECTVSEIDKINAKRKSGALAAGLNLLLPGVGYMYCGRILLGIVVLPFTALMLWSQPQFGLVMMAILVIDGFLAAGRYNKEIDEQLTSAMKTCPKCAEKVLPEAKICKHCKSDLQAA